MAHSQKEFRGHDPDYATMPDQVSFHPLSCKVGCSTAHARLHTNTQFTLCLIAGLFINVDRRAHAAHLLNTATASWGSLKRAIGITSRAERAAVNNLELQRRTCGIAAGTRESLD